MRHTAPQETGCDGSRACFSLRLAAFFEHRHTRNQCIVLSKALPQGFKSTHPILAACALTPAQSQRQRDTRARRPATRRGPRSRVSTVSLMPPML